MTEIKHAFMTCRAMPVQIEGQLDDGRWFYFRGRHGRIDLTASPLSAEDAVDRHIVGRSTVTRDHRNAGHLTEAEAFDVLRDMARELPAEVPLPPATDKGSEHPQP